jgi:hypothetical protein
MDPLLAIEMERPILSIVGRFFAAADPAISRI